ncbi:MAG: HAMP domain-containing sensor histidine kinase [Bacteroidota bacterium]
MSPALAAGRRPVSFLDVLRRWREPDARGLLLGWLAGCAVFVPSGMATRLLEWTGIPVTLGGTEVFVTVYVPLLFCVACVMWLGYAWGAIPAYLSTFCVALLGGMPLHWIVLFSFANPLGLAAFSMAYRAVPVRTDLRSGMALAFFALVAFVASVLGSAGSFVWAYTNRVGFHDLMPVWQGWWLGGFLQTLLINGPLLLVFGSRVERWKAEVGLDTATPPEASRRRLLAAFALVVTTVGGYVVLVREFSLARLDRALAEVGTRAPGVLAAVEGLSMIHWITLVLAVVTGVFGYGAAVLWTGRMRASRDALAEANAALEAEVAVRERAEADLRAANGALAEANASKDRFFSIIAHDLRSPLASVIQIAETLHEDVDEMDREELRLFLGMMERSATGLHDLLETLLAWARLQTGGMRYRPAALDLREVLAAAIGPLAPTAQAKGIALRVGAPPEARVEADPDMLRTLVMNLVSNAIKFTEPGGEIRVTARREGARMALAVRDTGRGMTPEQVAALFRVDTAVSTPGTNEEKGTGLGLVLCHEMVERHGSDLEVASEPGTGTTFRFTLATAEPAPVARQRPLEAVAD